MSRADTRYEPILSQTIVASVDNALAASTPAFLESIRMTTFTRKLRLPFQSNRADD
jgi:Ca2+-dependent lipid-binding protein